MIEFIKRNQQLSLSLLFSILFFLRKGIQYSAIGSFVPLLLIVGLFILLVVSLKLGKNAFVWTVRIWAIILFFWSIVRIFISIVHLAVKPFEGSFHLAQQFSAYGLVFSVLMLVLAIGLFRSLKKKRIKAWS